MPSGRTVTDCNYRQTYGLCATSASAALRTAVAADNPEWSARGTGEIKTRSASALLEQYEACFGQHPLLSGGQAAAGFPLRQVADYLNDLDQIP